MRHQPLPEYKHTDTRTRTRLNIQTQICKRTRDAGAHADSDFENVQHRLQRLCARVLACACVRDNVREFVFVCLCVCV